MFRALLRTQLAAFGAQLFQSVANRTKKASPLKMIGLALLVLYACFAFIMMFGLYFSQLAKPLFEMGIAWLYFALFAMAASALMFTGSVFIVKSQLYEAKDNDLLLAMPIPPRLILASRMTLLLLVNFIFELLIAIPALVMWLRAAPAAAGQLAVFILMVLALPFFSTAISGLFGWLLALIAARLRGNAPLTVLFSVVFLGLYMFYFSQANIYIQRLVLNGQAIAGALGSIVLLYWIGNAIVRLNSVHLIFSLLILLLPFALMYCLLSARFIRIATAKRGAVRVKYEMKAMRRSTRPSALFKRELKRFLSSPAYMLNSGLGILFIIAAAGALAVKKAAILALITQLGASGEQLVVIAVFALCLLTSTVMLTASSVSLEGKTLWAIRALPVPTRDILGAKLRLHIYMTAPAVVPASAALTYLLGPRVFDSLILLMAPVFFVMLSANIGLICNLYNVNLNWTNETQVIKQGISVLLAMLISSAAAFVPGLLYLLVPALSAHTLPFMAAYTISLLVGWRLSRSWIMTKGAEKFERLDS